MDGSVRQTDDRAPPGIRSVTIADLHIGGRLRGARAAHGLSQRGLAGLLGVSLQQVFKYENGKSRISAGRLYQIAKILDRPVAWFFEGLP